MTQRYHLSCMTLQDMERGTITHETFIPPSFADVPSLWRRWQQEDEEFARLRAQETDNRLDSSMRRSHSVAASRAASIRHLNRSDVPNQVQQPSLKELIALRDQRSREMDTNESEASALHNQHIVLMGKTPDLCAGRMDDVLSRTRSILGVQK